jgi:hypothetical protein
MRPRDALSARLQNNIYFYGFVLKSRKLNSYLRDFRILQSPSKSYEFLQPVCHGSVSREILIYTSARLTEPWHTNNFIDLSCSDGRGTFSDYLPRPSVAARPLGVPPNRG